MQNATISRLELFYRAHAPDEARRSQERIFERLDDLEQASETSIEKRAWPMRVILEGDRDEEARATLDSYARFAEWARENHVELDPYFHVHESHWFTGETHTELVVPVLCLAAYDEADDLVTVVPHTAEGHHATVSEFVQSLEADLGRAANRHPLTT